MLQKIKKNAGVCYILLITVVVALILLCTDEAGHIWTTLGTLDARWVWAAAGCIVSYLFLRVATLWCYLARRGYRIRWRDAIAVSGAGQFYSAITPSASGGQPMQVLYLHRRNVPVSIGTACISAKFIGFQTAILLIGGIMWLFNRPIVDQQIYGFRWFVGIGFAVNAGLLAVVAMTVRWMGALEWIVQKLLVLGVKLKIVRSGEEKMRKVRETLAEYQDAMRSLMSDPVDGVIVVGLSLLQVLAYMGVAWCMYRAFGGTEYGMGEILTLQNLLFIAAAFIPLPGAAGAQESGFLLFFQNIFPVNAMTAAMVSWRFFSYYLLLIFGALMMALGIRRKR